MSSSELNDEKKYSPRLSIKFDSQKDEENKELTGLLRGLMAVIEEGDEHIENKDDVLNPEKALVLSFKSVENAHYFKECAENYLSPSILERLQIKRRVFKKKKVVRK